MPIAELLDTLKATAADPIDDLVTRHPLQPFDVQNVQPGRLIPESPFTFDPTVLDTARAMAGTRAPQPAFVSGPLPAPPTGDVSLADLISFFKNPVKGFFRALDYTLPWDVDGVSDVMPVEIDALQVWTVGDRMLNDIMRGMTPQDAQQAEWRRGTLPPGRLGWRRAVELRDQAALLAAEALRYRRADGQAFDVDIALGSGRRLTGTVNSVFAERLVPVPTYSKLGGQHLLASWIPLLALTAQRGQRWSAVCIGRPPRGSTPRVQGLDAPNDAVGLLRDLVTMYDEGRRRPLPLPIKTSFAWAAPARPATTRRRRRTTAGATSATTPPSNGCGAATPTWPTWWAWMSTRSGSGCRCCTPRPPRERGRAHLRPDRTAARAGVDDRAGGQRRHR